MRNWIRRDFIFRIWIILKGYRWGYAKLRRKDSQFIRLNQEHMQYDQGIFLDVFICDNVLKKNYFLKHMQFCEFYIEKYFGLLGEKTEKGLKGLLFCGLSNDTRKYTENKLSQLL